MCGKCGVTNLYEYISVWSWYHKIRGHRSQISSSYQVELSVPKSQKLGQDVEVQVKEQIEDCHPCVQTGDSQFQHTLHDTQPVHLHMHRRNISNDTRGVVL